MRYRGLFFVSCLAGTVLLLEPIHALYVTVLGTAAYVFGVGDTIRLIRGEEMGDNDE